MPCFIFLIRKILQILWFFFYPISIFSWTNISLLTNIRDKWVIRKINFDLMKNGRIFPSKFCHFQCDHKFLLSREMGSSRTWKYVSKNLLNLNCRISFGIFQVGCKLIIIWEKFEDRHILWSLLSFESFFLRTS